MGRYEILRRYSRRLLNKGINDSTVLIASEKGRHTKDDTEHIIREMIRYDAFRKRIISSEMIWSIYAEAQDEKYVKSGLCEQCPPNTTRCYICSKLVGKDFYTNIQRNEWDYSVANNGIHYWCATPITNNLCTEYFNFRICCHECDAMTRGSNSYHTALRLGYNFLTERIPSLAIAEHVETLAYAFLVYFQYYKGAVHGV